MTLHSAQAIAQQLRRVAPYGAQLRQDSRTLNVGDVFVAFSGDVHDGRAFITAALKAGASAVLADSQGFESNDSRVVLVNDLKQSLGNIAHHFYGAPSQQLDCLGITGTNGKTTVSYWLAQLLQALQGKPSALLGTLGAGLLSHTVATGLTTPHASDVQRFLAQAVGANAGSACIEATSIGLAEGRLNGVAFKVAAFTNLTQDHLDYHGDMASYARAKRALFDWETITHAVINTDDAWGAALAAELAQQRPQLIIIRTGLIASADVRASDIRLHGNASQSFTLQHQGLSTAVTLPALGSFNVQNALTALACCIALGFDLSKALAVLSKVAAVPGRMQVVGNQPLVVVDFAHTPDGLSQALHALKPVASLRGGALHVVFGCGGDRDASKRPLMGAVAQQYADRITITNDNSRSENPSAIAAQIASAASKANTELDRAAAIAHAIAQARDADVVLIAGKGHETTQTIAGVSTPFSDVAHAQQALALRQKATV